MRSGSTAFAAAGRSIALFVADWLGEGLAADCEVWWLRRGRVDQHRNSDGAGLSGRHSYRASHTVDITREDREPHGEPSSDIGGHSCGAEPRLPSDHDLMQRRKSAALDTDRFARLHDRSSDM